MRLHVDRPVRVECSQVRWQWRCLCSPQAWPCTGSAESWVLAYADADAHSRCHRAGASGTGNAGRAAVVIDLAQRRTLRSLAARTGDAAGATRAGGDRAGVA